ncbi:YdcF family protein [Pararhizobium gei]|uniref:YdcF family protein n=1 Tax=Pararhizobium gei TaxID=1395951 RepID=UPI0023DC7F64|nr:YdcF family protein [Rhizobium gei]
MSDDEGMPRKALRTRRRVSFRRRLLRLTFYVLLLVAGIYAGGFLYFADSVASLQPPANPKADAIVVLTGGFQRIDQAVELLKTGAGRRLLISGVNPSTTGGQIRRNTQSSADLFKCCVDIGHDAMDTIGNANETANWIRNNKYRSILVVTNNYHMPRSLLELRRANPDIEFTAYPVVNSDLKSANWLTNPMVWKTILSEYAKLTIASVREALGAHRASGLRTDGGE